MAVSTATYACNFGTLVTATGTMAEVLGEMVAASSGATLGCRENLLGITFYHGGTLSTPSMAAVWQHKKVLADWQGFA